MASFHHSWLYSSSLKHFHSPFSSNNPNSFKSLNVSPSLFHSNAQCSKSTSSNSTESQSEPAPPPLDPIKLAFDRAKAYKKSVRPSSAFTPEGTDDIDDETKLSEKPHNKSAVHEEPNDEVNDTTSGFERGNQKHLEDESRRKAADKKGQLSISSIDFVGLGFADKKQSRRLPAGLMPLANPFPEQDLSDVEIIVGDITNFNDKAESKSQSVPEDDSDLYKPKVSTWGVFPRPNNISKTFGGGRVIHPGQVLESAEEKAKKEARTRELVAAYNTSIGLNIDAKLKSECEEALKEAESLMNVGKLKEALPYYEKVMDKLMFKSELHGLAALQWSICQDTLRREKEARIMYEKLRSHPNATVSKKARQLLFGFQAMEMMRVKTSSPFSSEKMGYTSYFEAFIENKSTTSQQEPDTEEGKLSQLLLYILVIISPIFLILILAVQKKL